jgi:hypothetical protein
MTEPEFDKFYKSLFVAFPSFRDFVNRQSPDPVGTLKTWFATLRNVTYDEADFVLQSWINGTGRGEPPKAYEQQFVARVILAQVEFRRNESNKFYVAKKLWEEKNAKQSETVKDDLLPMQYCFAMAASALAKQKRGEITRRDYDAELKRICSLKIGEVDLSAIEIPAMFQSIEVPA